MIRKLTENYVEMRGWNIEDFLHFIMKTETEDNHMELPVPTHLQGFLIPAGDKNSEYEVTGNIQGLKFGRAINAILSDWSVTSAGRKFCCLMLENMDGMDLSARKMSILTEVCL